MEADFYQIPTNLVYRLIWSIIGSIVAVGVYMVLWAINDSRVKAEQEQKIENAMAAIEKLENRMNTGILPIAAFEIAELKRRVNELEKNGDK